MHPSLTRYWYYRVKELGIETRLVAQAQKDEDEDGDGDDGHDGDDGVGGAGSGGTPGVTHSTLWKARVPTSLLRVHCMRSNTAYSHSFDT